MTDINALSRELYENAREKGFYEHEDMLREIVAATGSRSWISRLFDRVFGGRYPWRRQANIALAEHFGNRLMLIAGEAVEAHEEVRAGRGVAELYFRRPDTGKPTEDSHGYVTTNAPVLPHEYPEMADVLFKPEGVLAELADVAIRTLETMQSILDQADYDEATRLRGQVPESEATKYANEDDGPAPMPVNVAEVILLKHRFNQSRARKHGGKAF